MARLLADENFPLPVVEALGAHIHDVVTLADLGRAGQRVSDPEILALARAEQRVVLTLNRRDFSGCTGSIRITKESSRARLTRISPGRPDGFMRCCSRKASCEVSSFG